MPQTVMRVVTQVTGVDLGWGRFWTNHKKFPLTET